LIKIFKQKPNVEYTDELYDDGDCGYRGDYGYQIFTPSGECIAHDETDQWDDGAAMDNAEWDVQVLYIDELKKEQIMARVITNFGNERFEGTSEEFREMLKTKLAAPDQKLNFQIDDLSEKTKDNLIELFKPKF
jgi:hypothetical protein